MADAVIAQKSPYEVELKVGETYYWCSCGLSATQPFCDGSHKEKGEFSPIEFTVEKNDTYNLCGCKHNDSGPFCDGRHKEL